MSSVFNNFNTADQGRCLCKQCRSSSLIWIYTVCQSVFDFRLKPPFCNIGHVLIQGWESSIQKLRDERVNLFSPNKVFKRGYIEMFIFLLNSVFILRNQNYCIYPNYSAREVPSICKQYRAGLKEQFSQGLHCLPFHYSI